MEREPMTIQRLAKLIGESLVRGPKLAFYQPDIPTPPKWEDVKDAALTGYTTALNDVMDAILGDPQALEDALADWGRLYMREEDLAEALSHLERAADDLEESHWAGTGIYGSQH
ncbi:MAG: hypothetical protein ACLP5H_30720 [Desulfomonilaceae bacterium]